jgi:flagellar protein FliO/FliZ
MMFSVVLVVVLGAAALYMSKKVLPRITNLPGKEIRILETAHLGPRKAVHLVKIGNQRLLIGSTNESISMLADVTEQDEPDLVNLRGEQIDACVRE